MKRSVDKWLAYNLRTILLRREAFVFVATGCRDGRPDLVPDSVEFGNEFDDSGRVGRSRTMSA